MLVCNTVAFHSLRIMAYCLTRERALAFSHDILPSSVFGTKKNTFLIIMTKLIQVGYTSAREESCKVLNVGN